MLKEGVSTIGDFAFYNVSADIDTMRLPASVTYLGERAMAGMIGMQTLKSNAVDVPALGNEVWAGVDQPNVPLIVPDDAVSMYKAAEQWMNFFFTGDDYILGDVNGDGEVNIADVSALINYLLSGEGIDVRAADVSQDGDVTIADVSVLIDMLLGNSAKKNLKHLSLMGQPKPATSDVLVLPTVSIRAGDTRTIEVALNNDEHDYIGMQYEIVLPEGLELTAVKGIERGSNHSYYSRKNSIEDNVHTIIGISDDLSKFAGSEGNVMSLTITATEDYGARSAEVLITNVMFVTPRHQIYLAGDALGFVNDNATGVEQVNVDKQIAAVRYINMAGQESETPFDGLNIVVTTYTDGTTTTVKVLR